MKTIKLSIVGLLLCFSTANAQKQRYIDNVFTATTTVSGVVYGNNTNNTGAATNLLVDILSPTGDNATKRPLIIMAHEGSFLFGDKTDAYMTRYADRMVKKGYVVALMTYRKGWVPNLSGTAEDNSRAIIPAAWRAIQDQKACIRFFRKNASTYKIDPDRIFAGGFGAGAYLAPNGQHIDPADFSLPSFKQKDANGNPTSTPYIDTTMKTFGGVFDTTSSGTTGSGKFSYKVKAVVVYSGALLDTLLLNADGVPAICVHGTKDETTPYKTAIVNAQLAPGQLTPIVRVHGSYQMSRMLDKLGPNKVFNNITADGYPKTVDNDVKQGATIPYAKGCFPLVDETYMPWDCAQDAYTTTCEPYMDTVIDYTKFRLHIFLDKPVANFNPQTTNGSLDATFTDASTSSLSIASYAWNFGDGATSTLANPSHTYASVGDKTVKLVITNAAGSKDSTTKTITVGVNSIKSKYIQNLFVAYPNPATDVINLTINYGETIKAVTVNDVTGKEVYRSEGVVENINTSTLARGIYSITVNTNKGLGVQRIVLQ